MAVGFDGDGFARGANGRRLLAEGALFNLAVEGHTFAEGAAELFEGAQRGAGLHRIAELNETLEVGFGSEAQATSGGVDDGGVEEAEVGEGVVRSGRRGGGVGGEGRHAGE